MDEEEAKRILDDLSTQVQKTFGKIYCSSKDKINIDFCLMSFISSVVGGYFQNTCQPEVVTETTLKFYDCMKMITEHIKDKDIMMDDK